jgi:hypothetical protein
MIFLSNLGNLLFKTSIVIFFLLFISSLYGQELKVMGSIDIDRDKHRLIGQFDTSFLLFREGLNKYHIEALDVDFKSIWKRDLIFAKNQVKIYNVLKDENSIFVIYGINLKGKTEIRLKHINQEAAEICDVSILIFEKFINPADVNCVHAENRKNILIYTVKNEKTLYWSVFSIAEMRTLGNPLNELTRQGIDRHISQSLINNSGDVFFVLGYNNSRGRKNQNKIALISYFNNGKVNEFSVSLSGIIAVDTKFSFDEINNKICAAGLYSDRGFGTNGIFSIQQKNDSLFLQKIQFDETLKRNLSGEKKKNIDGVERLKINDLILRRDGGLLIIAEQFVKYEYQMPASYYRDIPSNRHNDYIYENILLSSINPDGSLHWNSVLYKSQKSENDEGRYSSFFLMRSSSGLRFIFNDELEWSASIYEYDVFPDGRQQRKRIFSEKESDDDMIPEFRNAVQISSNTVIFAQQKNSRLKLGKISFDSAQ